MASGTGQPRTYTISTETANGAVGPSRLVEEIAADSSITTALDYINTNGDTMDVYFVSALSGAEITALDAVVLAHSGLHLREWLSIVADQGFEAVDSGVSKVLANDRPAIEIQDGVTGFAAVQAVWPHPLMSLAEARVTARFILKATGTGSNVRIAARIKGDGEGDDSSGSFADSDAVAVAITHTTLGEVFEGVVTLDASSLNLGDSLAVHVGRDGAEDIGTGSADDCSEYIQIISFKIEGR